MYQLPDFSRNNLWYAATWQVANDPGVCGVSHYERHVTLQYETQNSAPELEGWKTTTHPVQKIQSAIHQQIQFSEVVSSR